MIKKYRLLFCTTTLPLKGIVDSQSIKNTDCASKKHKGFDDGKKVGGIKRHIITDTQGLPLAIDITPANQGERDICFHLLQNKHENESLKQLDEVYVDTVYKGDKFQYEVFQDTGITITVVPRKQNK